jgi:MFS family permease
MLTGISYSIFRGFKGVAGGGLFTMVMIVMADILSLKDRGKFQGMIEGVIAIR